MAYDAMEIANYIIKKHISINKPITNMKLQKLLYFAWIKYFKECGEHLFEDPIFAWRYGPVVREVYREYGVYGGVPISSPRGPEDMKEIDKSTAKCLDELIEKYKDTSASKLVKRTHKPGHPWQKVYQEGNNDVVIDFKDLEAVCNDEDITSFI